MILIKKKTVFNELAVSLFLMKELIYHPNAKNFIARLREKANQALEMAAPYMETPLSDMQIKAFLEAKPKHFTIDCSGDIMKGDTIRFTETVKNNCRKPPKIIGQRGITAYVVAINPPEDNPMVWLRVITSGGTWDLQPGTDIRRTMRGIIQYGVKRAAWEDEGQRLAIKTAKLMPKADATKPPPPPTSITLGRYDDLRSS